MDAFEGLKTPSLIFLGISNHPVFCPVVTLALDDDFPELICICQRSISREDEGACSRNRAGKAAALEHSAAPSNQLSFASDTLMAFLLSKTNYMIRKFQIVIDRVNGARRIDANPRCAPMPQISKQLFVPI